MNWPKKIEEIRKELNCTTAELTRKLGFEGQYIIDIEKGRSKNPSTKFITNLIKLGVNPLWIFLDQGDVFLSGGTINKKIETLENENSQLSKRLNETGVNVAEAVAILNDTLRLKTKHIGMVAKYIKSLAEKEMKSDRQNDI